MLITTISDMHGKLTEKALMNLFVRKGLPDVVFLLGDNYDSDVEVVLKLCLLNSIRPMPVYGICGNKEGRNMLKKHGVPDLHMKRTMFKDLIIGGFGGSLKFEENSYHLQFTDEECDYCLEEFPYCDILLTHDKPQFKAENVNPNLSDEEIQEFRKELENLLGIYKENMADDIVHFEEFQSKNPDIVFNDHKGLFGIGNYVKRQTPQIVLHGHLHDNFFSEHKVSRIKCCFDIETFEVVVDTDTAKHNESIAGFGKGVARKL